MCPISCVVQRGGVYFFGASIFHVCLLSGGENEYFFFVFDLFSFYYRFTNLKYLPSGENFCVLNRTRIEICVLNGGEYCVLNGGVSSNVPSVRFFPNPYTKIFAV